MYCSFFSPCSNRRPGRLYISFQAINEAHRQLEQSSPQRLCVPLLCSLHCRKALAQHEHTSFVLLHILSAGMGAAPSGQLRHGRHAQAPNEVLLPDHQSIRTTRVNATTWCEGNDHGCIGNTQVCWMTWAGSHALCCCISYRLEHVI